MLFGALNITTANNDDEISATFLTYTFTISIPIKTLICNINNNIFEVYIIPLNNNATNNEKKQQY